MKPDALGERMKKYEYVTRTHLVPRMPMIIRLDGRSFHSFTHGFQKPFDEILVKTMQETMKYLCENIQGCVLGYTQSDEITLVLVDYKKLESSSWFDYNIQKCASIAASMATMKFNKVFEDVLWKSFIDAKLEDELDDKYYSSLISSLNRGAMFDARCFNIPKEEVCNCILWRQNDAARNSVQMVGQAHFSHKALHTKSCSEIREMLLKEGIDWNELPTHLKHGSCCIKKLTDGSERLKWVIDTDIPVFKGEGRRYIDDLIYVGE